MTAHDDAKNPVTGYLGSLVWDGTPRLDRWLVDLAGAEGTEDVRKASRAVLAAARDDLNRQRSERK